MSKWFSARNLLAAAAAPFTAGTSLAFMNNGDGDSILGDITGSNQAKKANEQNIALQKATNEQSIALANSAHQREIADLKAAGLNPVLSAGGNGSATPTLGTAQVQNTMPGGYLAQAGQAMNLVGTMAAAKQAASTAQQAQSQANLNNVNAELQPAIAKAQIAADFANAGSAKATADYTTAMKDVDIALKKSMQGTELTKQELNDALTYRNKNLSKGEQSRLWTQAITGGLLNIAGASTGTMGAINTARGLQLGGGYAGNRGIGFHF